MLKKNSLPSNRSFTINYNFFGLLIYAIFTFVLGLVTLIAIGRESYFAPFLLASECLLLTIFLASFILKISFSGFKFHMKKAQYFVDKFFTFFITGCSMLIALIILLGGMNASFYFVTHPEKVLIDIRKDLLQKDKDHLSTFLTVLRPTGLFSRPDNDGTLVCHVETGEVLDRYIFRSEYGNFIKVLLLQ